MNISHKNVKPKNTITLGVPLLSLVVEAMCDLVTDDGPDGREVHVPRDVLVEENALENSGGKFKKVGGDAVESVHHCYVGVLEPRVPVDLFPEAVVVEGPPELDDVQGVFKIGLSAHLQPLENAVDGLLVNELVPVADELIHLVQLVDRSLPSLFIHPVDLLEDVFLKRLPDVRGHLLHGLFGFGIEKLPDVHASGRQPEAEASGK